MTKSDLPFMPKFFDRYINLVEDHTQLIDGLKDNISVFEEVKSQLELKADYQYQEGKWTVKQLLQHCIDTERVMSFRALVFAREGNVELPGMDENLYADNADVSSKSIENLLTEFKTVRESSIFLFESLTESQLLQVGTCFGKEMTPLAIGLVVIGHPRHHLNTLKEYYF